MINTSITRRWGKMIDFRGTIFWDKIIPEILQKTLPPNILRSISFWVRLISIFTYGDGVYCKVFNHISTNSTSEMYIIFSVFGLIVFFFFSYFICMIFWQTKSDILIQLFVCFPADGYIYLPKLEYV